MKKVMLVFGTRPEAIKMCPVVKALKCHSNIKTVVCVSGQHREMLKQVLDCFNVQPDYNLDIMKPGQTLFEITEKILTGMRNVYEKEKPDIVLVHGDTSTAFAAALAAFYMNIPVGHVEAGLRTYNNQSPYPEEFNRQAIGSVASLHFAPTEQAKRNLIDEHKNEKDIFVTGNTSIDALSTTVRSDYTHKELDWVKNKRFVMLTAHRRENLGEPLLHIFTGIKKAVDEHPDVRIIYPIHMNPVVRETAEKVFGADSQIKMIEPLEVLDFHNFMAKAEIILTDSGGIQEEAPALGKPVLVLRNTTERPEGVAAGTLKLVGTDENTIYNEFKKLLDDPAERERMSRAVNPYGDGTASRQIADILLRWLSNRT